MAQVLDRLSQLQKQRVTIFRLSVLENPYIRHRPTEKQAEFLWSDATEALYGGAAGGGKSEALLMAALQFVQVPGYSALLLRRSFRDLALPGALMDRAREWLNETDAVFNQQKCTWTFPSGAKLVFGYLDSETDKYHYQSAEFQFIGFDELTQFTEDQYRYLFSRLRRLENSNVPLRMRCASNPGNIGHEWVKRRFITEGESSGRPFYPARLNDNPFLDREQYVRSLSQLDPITRRQYLDGDWTARQTGGKFQREWFQIVEAYPSDCNFVRYWDMAATSAAVGKDPDYTVGAKVGFSQGVYYLVDIQRLRADPRNVEERIKQTAMLDREMHGNNMEIYMEQEPGSAGVAAIDHYSRIVLVGYAFRPDRVTGSKELRANPVSSAAEAGNLKLVRGVWNTEFLDEAEAFPHGGHDDQVDAVSGAFNKLTIPRPPMIWFSGRMPGA